MAHPKLSAAVNRSVLTVSAAALIAGPLAGAALAQTTGTLDPVLDLTCAQARETEDPKLIEEFCDDEQPSESPLQKSVDEVTKTTDTTVKQATDAVAPKKENPDKQPAPTDGGGGSGSPTDPVLNPDKPTANNPAPKTGTNTGSQVENSGNNFREVPKSRQNDGLTKAGTARRGKKAEAPGYSFNANGPFIPGMQSQSSLTLQPFAAPLVSVPPVYELPQIAQELFGTATGTAVDSPQVAGASSATAATAASPYSPAGYSATTADPTGWLAATATGLIMLVGAAHALNGGRTPRRSKA